MRSTNTKRSEIRHKSNPIHEKVERPKSPNAIVFCLVADCTDPAACAHGSCFSDKCRVPIATWSGGGQLGVDHEWMAYEHTTEQSGSEPLQPGNCGHRPSAFVGNLIPTCLGMFSWSDTARLSKMHAKWPLSASYAEVAYHTRPPTMAQLHLSQHTTSIMPATHAHE